MVDPGVGGRSLAFLLDSGQVFLNRTNFLISNSSAFLERGRVSVVASPSYREQYRCNLAWPDPTRLFLFRGRKRRKDSKFAGSFPNLHSGQTVFRVASLRSPLPSVGRFLANCPGSRSRLAPLTRPLVDGLQSGPAADVVWLEMRSPLRTPFVKSEPFSARFPLGGRTIPLASERVMAPRCVLSRYRLVGGGDHATGPANFLPGRNGAFLECLPRPLIPRTKSVVNLLLKNINKFSSRILLCFCTFRNNTRKNS